MSEERDVLKAIVATGEIQRLQRLSDRQVGQLMFDHVWDALKRVSLAMTIGIEATERLFRSPAGARCRNEVFNHPDKLPDCPKCGEPKMHLVGIGEPDYLLCVSKASAHKIAETDEETDR